MDQLWFAGKHYLDTIPVFQSYPLLALIPASSNHPGGVNSLMGDGSVHFISESIDADVWRALGTRSGRESVSLPF
jgi:prepilin-type processing-associated H-X9-DG protein